MAAVCHRAGHYIFVLWFLPPFSFFSLVFSRRRLDVYHYTQKKLSSTDYNDKFRLRCFRVTEKLPNAISCTKYMTSRRTPTEITRLTNVFRKYRINFSHPVSGISPIFPQVAMTRVKVCTAVQDCCKGRLISIWNGTFGGPAAQKPFNRSTWNLACAF